MSPCQSFSFVQFPGVQPTDTILGINGLTVAPLMTTNALVAANPQFWFQFGNSGVNTLHSAMIVGGVDLVVTYTNGGPMMTSTAIPLTDHPIHRPK